MSARAQMADSGERRALMGEDAAALSPTDMTLCQPEPEAQAVAALPQSGSLPQCFDDWCKSRRHDPACART